MRSWQRTIALLLGLVAGLSHTQPGFAQGAEPPSLTLEEAIWRALEHDPAAVAAEGAISSASADLLEARGAWLPSLSINSSYSNSSNQRFDQASGRLVSESYTAQASAGYDLFDGGRRYFQGRSVGARVKSADAAYRAQRFQTILKTTEAFYGTVAASELLRVANQRLERARQQLDFARTRLEVGTATRSDVLRAELEVGNAELALVDAESALRSTELRLGRLVGLERGAKPASAELPGRAPDLPARDEIVQRAISRSPDVLSTRASLDERKASRWVLRTVYLPTLRLSGGYDWFSYQFPPDQRSWSLRLTASLPLFNGFQREAASSRAAVAERSAEARARDAVLGARVAAEDAVQEIDSAERRVQIAERAVELAHEDLRVQEERYRIGNATIVELQTSQLALVDAEAAHVRARHALGVAVARLEAVLGEKLVEAR